MVNHKSNMSKTKKKRSSKKKKMTVEQAVALKYVNEWVYMDSPASQTDDFLIPSSLKSKENLVFEMHSHTICSDGFLSPTALVKRAHMNGVKVLALTDHDTMAGIPEAIDAANKYGIRIIPGVEISTIFSPRVEAGNDEPVHILAYYGSCGPARIEELENCLASIRDGRYIRAKNMLSKLKNLKMPLKWEHVTRIAGNGVAPGRLHVARAMVEAGHVENLKQAFSRYLYDGGPAYATGSEPLAEEAVELICRTGGVAALAHPWALKNPVAVIRSLKTAGLHAMEVYRSDGKVAGFSDLADTYDLVKLGGSDYHGRGGNDESDLGSVNLPILAIREFLRLGRPIWCKATKDILQTFAEEPSHSNLEKIMKFLRIRKTNGNVPLDCGKDIVDICQSLWLSSDERQSIELEALSAKLSEAVIAQELPRCL
ncbi:hypothetical protein H6P81_011519 [Aristolochia fimbriata]|uniref:Polymerase/histidinol phosphatase N-terminal domain-containing protein n=1 Tax=Aristolochia fimbriata TaxID=158543 RepID=A0AAV7ET20_ARIFI|nr:hypothetical protein H6P81_011519 [Aristolochia fimbriata]